MECFIINGTTINLAIDLRASKNNYIIPFSVIIFVSNVLNRGVPVQEILGHLCLNLILMYSSKSVGGSKLGLRVVAHPIYNPLCIRDTTLDHVYMLYIFERRKENVDFV